MSSDTSSCDEADSESGTQDFKTMDTGTDSDTDTEKLVSMTTGPGSGLGHVSKPKSGW